MFNVLQWKTLIQQIGTSSMYYLSQWNYHNIDKYMGGDVLVKLENGNTVWWNHNKANDGVQMTRFVQDDVSS